MVENKYYKMKSEKEGTLSKEDKSMHSFKSQIFKTFNWNNKKK